MIAVFALVLPGKFRVQIVEFSGSLLNCDCKSKAKFSGRF